MRLAALIAASVLCGCAPAPASGPAHASVLAADLEIVGDQLAWKVLVSNETKMSDFAPPGSPDTMNAAYPVESNAADGAILLTIDAPGGGTVFSLRPVKCRDGVTTREYPWEATADYKGQALKGCAGPKHAPVG
jgi:uncharacterized membrane protein